MSSVGHYMTPDGDTPYGSRMEKIAERREPDPIRTKHPAIWDLVEADFKERDQFGERKYRTRLQPFNGRDVLVDLYQELMDGIVYIRQAIYEREFESKVINSAIAFALNLNHENDEELFTVLCVAVKDLLNARAKKRE